MQEAKAAEEDREARIRAEYVAAIPQEIKEQVEAAVHKEIATMREAVVQDYTSQAERLMEAIKSLKV
jgi:uncharacterized protein with HEPN domain